MFNKVFIPLLFASGVIAAPMPQNRRGNRGTYFSEKDGRRKPCRSSRNFQVVPTDTDTKTSCTTGIPAFAPFDDKEAGDQFSLGCATLDEECRSKCSDGVRCRAPDALKNGATCRDGHRPVFGADGALSFVKESSASAPGPADNCPATGSAGNDAPAEEEEQADAPEENEAEEAQSDANDEEEEEEAEEDNNAGTYFSEKENVDKPCRNAGNSQLVPEDTDVKTSCTTGLEEFAIMDNKQGGDQFTLGCAVRDEDCLVRCSDGLRCRAPDALKPGESCRDGIRPEFGADGGLTLVQGDVAPASTKVEFPNGPNCPIN